MQVASAIGPGLAGAALLQLSVAQVYVVFGLAQFACAFGYCIVPRYREFLALDHETVKGWYGREYQLAFLRGKNVVVSTPGVVRDPL
ncbi:hypothetical protein ACUHMQ_08695 [Chitinimonas sp. PSY-7]|uniref:hypothetical protein n=1 Tax=Chitinimonas sp. PSY-7 TaxID=3459088 RepID=UPI00403FCE71